MCLLQHTSTTDITITANKIPRIIVVAIALSGHVNVHICLFVSSRPPALLTRSVAKVVGFIVGEISSFSEGII